MNFTNLDTHKLCPCCGKTLATLATLGETFTSMAFSVCLFCLTPLRAPDGPFIFFEILDLDDLPDNLREAFENTIQIASDAKRDHLAQRERLH